MAELIHILHVDDDPDFADVTKRSLEREDSRFTVETTTSIDDALDRLPSTTIDCIVSDYDMPSLDGIEFLSRVREIDPDLPFILFTGKGSETVASEAISAGVTDYLQKQPGSEQYELLANRIANAVTQARTAQELQEERHRFRILFERLTQATVEVEYEGNEPIVKQVNPAFEETFGYDAEAIVGDSLDEYIVPEEYESEAADINTRVRDEGRLVSEEVTRQTADGKRTFLLQNAVYDDGSGGFAIYTDITDRKERERELEEYQTIVEAAPDPIAVVDTDGRYQYVNPAFSKLTDYPESTLLGEHFSLIKPDAEADQTQAAFDELMTTDETTTVRSEALLETTSDRSIICEDHMAVLSDGAEPRGAVIIHRDVTERVVRTDQLQEERDRLTTLFENLPVPVVHGEVRDGEPIIRSVNRQFETVFGYSAAEARGENLDALTVPPDREEEAIAINQELIEEGYLRQELRRQTADGLRDFELRAVIRSETDPPEGYAIYTDITDRKQREQELQRNERIIEAMNDGVVVVQDQTITYTNPQVSELVGIPVDEIEMTDMSQFIAPEDRELVEQRYQARMAGEDPPSPYEIRILSDHGERIPVEITVARVEYDHEPATVSIVRDISERKERERKLERQNDRLEEFASVVSHDLRNPLNVATGQLELAQQACENEHLERVADAHERMERLIDDLLTLARSGQPIEQPQTVDVGRIARTCWENVATDNAEFSVDIDQTIQADPSRLKQLFENLIRNAIEHSNQSTTVRIGGLEGEDGFYIEDTGPGIPEAERTKVFESGYTTTDDGTGFGLTIVQEIVEAHDWEITITAGSEGGARFEITDVD
ncbi:MAG: PAS domain S-box protein [Halobacteriales archaeon]|nr:PAS domain S-box protein [Halobacteriales archaeon]